jgi:hypothetical protein
MGVLNISHPWQINTREITDISSWRGCSKKSVQQGHSYFDARSVLPVREPGKMARTPLAAFFNIPIMIPLHHTRLAIHTSTKSGLSLVGWAVYNAEHDSLDILEEEKCYLLIGNKPESD